MKLKGEFYEVSKKISKSKESALDFSVRMANSHIVRYKPSIRKKNGQFFTPKPIASFMANLFNLDFGDIRLLDPGSGTGILVAAFCEELLKNANEKVKLTVVAYENEENLLPILKDTLEKCKEEMKQNGHEMFCYIVEKDFISHNAHFFQKTCEEKAESRLNPFDVVISNPPYYKLNKDSPQSVALKELVYGQPNIYALFLGLSTSLLKDNGQIVFITPRSFCSGLYYKKLREWFVNNTYLNHIHVFESRKDIFNIDGVLQENVIIKAIKKEVNDTKQLNELNVSVSKDKSFNDFIQFRTSFEDAIYRKNGDLFIRVPSSQVDLEVMHMIDQWPNTLSDMGLNISTGPVVAFRAKEHLKSEYNSSKDVPLLWMHNIRGFDVKWPLDKNNKEKAIRVNKKSKSILLPIKNLVLVKRFSSKEQNRRLYAGVLLEQDYKEFEYVGIENHLNYIYRVGGFLNKPESYGIAAILNTCLIDNYFRTLNGNTQVNAIDIKSLSFPSIDKIVEIGCTILDKKPKIGYELDTIVAKILNLDPKLIDRLFKREKYEQD